VLTNPHQCVTSCHSIGMGKSRSIQSHRFLGRRFVYGLRICVGRAGVGETRSHLALLTSSKEVSDASGDTN
jgi:hypothetical protein